MPPLEPLIGLVSPRAPAPLFASLTRCPLLGNITSPYVLWPVVRAVRLMIFVQASHRRWTSLAGRTAPRFRRGAEIVAEDQPSWSTPLGPRVGTQPTPLQPADSIRRWLALPPRMVSSCGCWSVSHYARQGWLLPSLGVQETPTCVRPAARGPCGAAQRHR